MEIKKMEPAVVVMGRGTEYESLDTLKIGMFLILL